MAAGLSEYFRDQERYWGLPVPSHLKHGPNSRAVRIYGCDCKTCLPSGKRYKQPGGPITHKDRQKKLRETKKGKPVPEGTKHGVYAYRTYGCKCDICRAARSRKSHQEKNPWMYRPTRGHWVEKDGVTSLCWPPATAGTDWECDCGWSAKEEVV